jgi:glycosyltransferase involved in cell wall biosynthesis
MVDQMIFGCLTLSFNQGEYLAEAIDSILNQNINIDYLVYDPGSSDISRKVIQNYNPELVKQCFVKGDEGPADGLNKGLEMIRGDIFYYLNADDRVLPGAFNFVNQYFIDNPDCDILHGSINLIDQFGKTYRTLPAMKFSLRGYAHGYSFVYQQATFIRKNIIPKNAFNVKNKVSWDGELIIDLVLAGASVHQTQTVLGDFRIYSTSITGSGRLLELAKSEHLRISRKILGRNPHCWEKILAYLIKKVLALKRRTFPNSLPLNR